MKSAWWLSLWLVLTLCGSANAQTAAPPAEMISSFRQHHGEGRVTLDSMLNRIAHDQAAAMAAKDVLDHDVLGRFSSRVAASGSGRAAENIAYGYDSFPKTLNQWIDSAEHRKNLLLHNASRVGIASVKSTKTGRTYWAMEIAGDYERPEGIGTKRTPTTRKPKVGSTASAKPAPTVGAKTSAPQTCRLKILSLCL
jgi:Cysteine-rich secretory protein family